MAKIRSSEAMDVVLEELVARDPTVGDKGVLLRKAVAFYKNYLDRADQGYECQYVHSETGEVIPIVNR